VLLGYHRIVGGRAGAIKILPFQLLINYNAYLLALVERAADGAATPPAALTTTRKALVMADRKLTLPMTIDEIRALADRLEARGTSVLMRDQPAQCADLERAAHLLRLLTAPTHLPAAASDVVESVSHTPR